MKKTSNNSILRVWTVNCLNEPEQRSKEDKGCEVLQVEHFDNARVIVEIVRKYREVFD